MKCRATRRHLSAFMDDRLTAPEARALEAHLAECAACRAWADEYRQLAASLKMMGPAVVPSGLADRAYAAAMATPPSPSRLDIIYPLVVRATVAAGVAAAVTVTAAWWQGPDPSRTEQGRLALMNAQFDQPKNLAQDILALDPQDSGR